MTGIRDCIRAEIARNPSITNRELRKRTGLSAKQVHNARWQTEHLERCDAHARAYYVRNRETILAKKEQERRDQGMRPLADISAEADNRAKTAAKLKRKGSFTEVGKALGITRNAVAGRLWRAKQRAEREGAQA